MNPLALAASLALHAAVGVWLWAALPDFGERLRVATPVAIEFVELTEADTPLEVPAEAAPLPEQAPTRTPEPSPPATEPSPEPAGTPPAGTPPADEPAPEPEVAAVEPVPAAEPEPMREPTPPAPAEPTPETAAAPAAPPTPVVEPEPEPAAREPVPPVAATAEPEAAAEPAVAAAPRRRPREVEVADASPEPPGTPQPNPDTRPEAEPEPDPLDALLQSVEQLSRRVEADVEREGEGAADVAAPTGELAAARAQRLGALIYDQIIGCWSVPRGVDGLAEVGAVELRVAFEPSGDVASTRVEDQARLETDRVFRAVAESANRAVYNCTPLVGMPAEHYDAWRLVILEFRPDQIATEG